MARRRTTRDTDPGTEPGDGEVTEPAALTQAADTLYATDPDDFVAARDRLVRQAREDGDPATATRIGRLRKPTVAAYVVNRHALAAPDTVSRLLDLHQRLRDAQTALDTDALRQLTEERRTVVAGLAAEALADAGLADAPTALREDVIATLDAAVADPEVAGRLGRLVRAEHWSGFGVAATDLPPDAPALRLVRGGRDAGRAGTPPARTAPAQKPRARAEPEPPAALRKAEQAAAAADSAVADAAEAERAARERVRELSDELARVQVRLAEARTEHERARRDVADARSRQRQARTALERAQRRTGR